MLEQILVTTIWLITNMSMKLDSKYMFLPVKGALITSTFGLRTHPITKKSSFHEGIDMQGKQGDFIRTVGTGKVIYTGRYRGYGNLVVIRHGDNLTSHYAHCDKIIVNLGEFVKGGQVIGSIGRTGKTTGPHLHFEIRKDGIALDPLLMIKTVREGKS